MELLRKKLFGTSSEKRSADLPGQLNLFNEAEMEQDPAAAEAEEMAALLPEKKRKARAANAERFKGLPVKKEYLDIPEEERFCPVCNAPLEKIGEEYHLNVCRPDAIQWSVAGGAAILSEQQPTYRL